MGFDSDVRLAYEEALALLRAEVAALREERDEARRCQTEAALQWSEAYGSARRELEQARALLARMMEHTGCGDCLDAGRAFLAPRRDEVARE